MKKYKQTKPQKIGIKPIHPIAEFIVPSRKRVGLLTKIETSIAGLIPPGVRLTANQLKVWIVLLAAKIGRTNLAPIDQQMIAELSGVARPNVARAIAGLRRKKLVRKTWMDAGPKMFRNVYALWAPPELEERDANAQLRKRNKATVLEQQADELEKQSHAEEADKLRQQAQKVRTVTCPYCGGEGMVMVYLPKEQRERTRWCDCSIGHRKAEELGGLNDVFVPDHMLARMLGTDTDR
jgi:hypothetical protein